MSRKLNEEDMEVMLNSVLDFGEVYTSKIWALTKKQKTSMKKFDIIGIISSSWRNMFSPVIKTSYVGLTEDKIVIITTKLVNISKIREVHILEISKIKRIYMTNYMLMKNGKTITVEYSDGNTYEIMTNPQQYKGNFAGQERNLEAFLSRFF